MTDQPEATPGSTKPYLIRAIYDWCLDEGQTPQIMVDVNVDDVAVPASYVKDGKIVLNLHPNSVRQMEMGNEYLLFSARFSGRAEEIIVPVDSVLAVYARENGQGIVFQADGSGVTPPSPGRKQKIDMEPVSGNDDSAKTQAKPTSHLKIVK